MTIFHRSLGRLILISLLLFLLCYLVSETIAEDADSRRMFLFPQSEQISSIVSRQYRTAFHFQPPKNWINDPNGPMFHNGFYHLFYQYNPNASVWGNIHWGHSVSHDLINWAVLQPAIAPTKPFDLNGCWTGSATILPGNKPVIIYTGSNQEGEQVQNIAFPKNLSDPFLRKWYKPDYNPLMLPIGGINSSSFRDPTTGWLGSDGHWRIAVGAEIEEMGTALLYKSEDFVNWTRGNAPLHSSKGSGMWECPDFYPVSLEGSQGLDASENSGDLKHVLKMSVGEKGTDNYMVGRYDEEKEIFVPDNASDDYKLWLRYDYGMFYASKSFFDARKKRRILWGWLIETDSIADDLAKGWAGIQTVPRTILLDSKGYHLMQWPIEEVESLRTKRVHLDGREIKTGDVLEIAGIKASQVDVEVDFQLQSLESAQPFDPSWLLNASELCTKEDGSIKGGIGPFGLLVLASANLEEHTAIFFRVYKDGNIYRVLMCSDQKRSSLRPEIKKPVYGAFLSIDIEQQRRISLRTLVDHSVIESFGDGGRSCITARVYPALLLNSSTHLFVFNNGYEPVTVAQLNAWNMSKAHLNIRPEDLLKDWRSK